MALIAKSPLRIGFTLVANPGNVVSADAVEEYGWHDKVYDDGQGDPDLEANAEPDETGEPTPRPRRRKKAPSTE